MKSFEIAVGAPERYYQQPMMVPSYAATPSNYATVTVEQQQQGQVPPNQDLQSQDQSIPPQEAAR